MFTTNGFDGEYMIGEQKLWIAVIEQAFHEALMPMYRLGKDGEPNPSVNIINVRKARRWLKNKNKDFNSVCGLAGLDPLWVMFIYGKTKKMKIKPKYQWKENKPVE